MENAGTLRILIVEDNPGDLFLVGEYLKEGKWKTEITPASRLSEAVSLASTKEFDLILLDLTLPDSTGMESVKELLPLVPAIPLIVLTGMEHEQYGVDSLKLGAQDYLVKDQINGPLLVKSILYSIERSRAENRLKVSEERYRNLFEVSPASIVVWDTETKLILQVNETAEKEYGYLREEFKGLPIRAIMGDVNFVQELLEMAQRIRQGNNTDNKGVSKRIRRDGQVIMMEHHAHLMGYNGVQAMLLLEQNVTEKMELEATLEAERLARQQLVTDAVLSAQEQERQAIGIELHDNINQILASARLYLGLVKSLVPEHVSFVDESDKLINNAINEIRNLSHALILPTLSETQLLEALDHIISTTRKTSGISITRSYHDLQESQLSDKLKLTIYRIVQEQFNNILKYANAKSVSVNLQAEGKKIVLHIIDDGIGFDHTKKTSGVGFMNMRTRASLFNGDLQINSSPGKGCELIVEMDLES